MLEQIIRVVLNGIGVRCALLAVVDDLCRDGGGHVLCRYTALKDIIAALDGSQVFDIYLLITVFRAGVRDGKLHICAVALLHAVIQLHVEVDRDVAVERDGMSQKPCAYAVRVSGFCVGAGLAVELYRRGIGDDTVLCFACNRRVNRFLMLTAGVRAGEFSRCVAVVVSPRPLGFAVGVSVGEQIAYTLLTEG